MKNLLILFLLLVTGYLVAAQDLPKQKTVYRTDFTGYPFRTLDDDTLYLEAFAGKYVLIDVWSPMCGICLREYPGLFEMIKKYPQVQLVALCASPNVAYWKSEVKKRNFKGLQIFESTASDFLKEAGIRGVPRLILLDPKGQVLNSSLPLPSKHEFKEALEKCLKEYQERT